MRASTPDTPSARPQDPDEAAREDGEDRDDREGREDRDDREGREDRDDREVTADGTEGREDTAAGTEHRGGPLGRVTPLVLAALALVVAAAVAAAWGGWAWYSAAHDDDAAFARARDTVLAAGEQAVQNMNTLDHGDVDHGLDVWESSTTGELHSQLVQGRADFVKEVRQAQTVSTAKVLSGAVTELDTRAGKAGVMVALRITVRAPKGGPSVKESRMLGELTRTPAGWKLSALGQAPLGDSADTAADSSADTGAGSGADSGTGQPSPGR
jgi:Mce-associated membrane protein